MDRDRNKGEAMGMFCFEVFYFVLGNGGLVLMLCLLYMRPGWATEPTECSFVLALTSLPPSLVGFLTIRHSITAFGQSPMRALFALRYIILLEITFASAQLFYASCYSSIGLNGPEKVSHSLFDALYFSIITWTTVGYGDFSPTPS